MGLSDAEKLWLDTDSLEDLSLDFTQACLKPQARSSSKFRGVTLRPSGKYLVRVHKRINHQSVPVFSQRYEDETEAARAYDRVALQYYGRCVHAEPLHRQQPSGELCRLREACADPTLRRAQAREDELRLLRGRAG